MGDEAFVHLGLSSSYAILLITVNDKPGIQPKEICHEMQLTPSTVTRLIEKLEHRGLVERRKAGRSTEVYPTEKSLKLQPEIKTAWANLKKKYSELLGEKNGEKLTADIYEAVKKLE